MEWYAKFQRDLPWRHTQDAYRVWISEIMLQQTRVATVIPYYERFLSRFPNIAALAAAPEEEVLRFWSGLGYYSRARNLLLAAKKIVTRHGGKFPDTRTAALELPGIGHYTAAAILSIAFGEKLAVLDGNVARVLARLDVLHGDLRSPRRWSELQTRADELLAPAEPGDWNQAMMEFGATLCTPRSPQCLICPVQRFCGARRAGIVEELPEKREKPATVSVQLATAVFLDPFGRTLVLAPPVKSSRSDADDHIPSLMAKLWHFPTVVAGEGPERQLKEFLEKNLKVKISRQPVDVLDRVSHTVTFRRINVYPLVIRMKRLPKVERAKQVQLHKLLDMPISNLTRKVALKALASQPARAK